MAIGIEYDANAPTAAVELPIKHPLPDYDLEEVEASVPREVDPMLASQGFKDLLDEARSVLGALLAGTGLEIAQLTGAICHEGAVFRPGLWLVLRESAAASQAMSASARAHVARVAEQLRARLSLA